MAFDAAVRLRPLPEPVVRILVSRLDAEQPISVRLGALRKLTAPPAAGLNPLPMPEAIRFIAVEGLSDADDEVRLRCGLLLTDPPELREAVVATLGKLAAESWRTPIRIDALRQLGAMGRAASAAEPQIRSACHAPREAAAAALVALPDALRSRFAPIP